ncbi:MAG: NFACT family protein [bacterium]|nr:MAG: NFACT family protein [bacterium]
MDYLSLRAAAAAVASIIKGSRLAEARLLARSEVALRFGRGPLVILSIHPERPGVFLTRRDGTDPGKRTSFADILTTHLSGTTLTDLSFPIPGDRVLRMVFSGGWPRQEGAENALILEVMGRHSNLVLTDGDGRIIAPMKPVPTFKSRVRPLVAGKEWAPPPERRGIPIEAVGPDDLKDIPGPHPDRNLLDAVRGLSPMTARIVLRMAERDRAPISEVLASVLRSCDGSRGSILYIDGRPVLVPFDAGALEDVTADEYPDFPSAALAWRDTLQTAGIEDARDDLELSVLGSLERARRELASVEQEIARCLDHETVRFRAESLLNHMNRIRRRDRRIELPHPHRPGETLAIAVDPSVSVPENARRLFDEARRMKRGLTELNGRRDSLLESILSLEEALSALQAGDQEAARALTSLRDPPTRARVPGGAGREKGPGRRYERRGFVILVGRSAADNERVTFTAAGPHDLWMHARDYAGSHVVILTGKRTVPEDVIRYAASLASQSSRAKGDPTVEVMVTERKWVRKRKGGRPGQVTVERYRTVRPERTS